MIAIPVTIDTAEFVAFLRGEFGGLADSFGWTTEDSVRQLAIDALLAVGQPALASVQGAKEVRTFKAVAKAFAWRKAAQLTAGDYDFSADGGRYDRSQVHAHALKLAAQAEAEASELGVDLTGGSTAFINPIAYGDESAAVPTEWTF